MLWINGKLARFFISGPVFKLKAEKMAKKRGKVTKHTKSSVSLVFRSLDQKPDQISNI